jgi:hypothetical protein
MYIIAYPESLIEYVSPEEAYSRALDLAVKTGNTLGVYEVTPVRAIVPPPLPPPAMPPRAI